MTAPGGPGPSGISLYESTSKELEISSEESLSLNEEERLNLQDLVTLAKCADTDESFCPVTWWKQNSKQLPVWGAAFRKVLLVQPSSAAASEHVFSLCLLQ